MSSIPPWSWSSRPQNLVMFLSLLVAWLIPDIPKPIVEQLKREKTLLVDVFLREEKEKCQLIHSLFSGGPAGSGLGVAAASGSPPFHLHHRHHHHHHPTGAPAEPGRYSTLPTVSQAHQAAWDPGTGPQHRARCRASSCSQFSPQTSSAEADTSKHTAV